MTFCHSISLIPNNRHIFCLKGICFYFELFCHFFLNCNTRFLCHSFGIIASFFFFFLFMQSILFLKTCFYHIYQYNQHFSCNHFLSGFEFSKATHVSLDARGENVERITNFNSFNGEPTASTESAENPLASFEIEIFHFVVG